MAKVSSEAETAYKVIINTYYRDEDYMLLNHEQVKSFLPHRSPFLFIDTIKEVILSDEAKGKDKIVTKDLIGAKVIAFFEVKESLEILKGHFPGMPILPGVVLIELMAQASAFVSVPLTDFSLADLNVETLLLSVTNSKFRKLVTPGMNLEIHTTLIKNRGSIAYYSSEVFCEGDKVAEAEFMAKLIIKKNETDKG